MNVGDKPVDCVADLHEQRVVCAAGVRVQVRVRALARVGGGGSAVKRTLHFVRGLLGAQRQRMLPGDRRLRRGQR